MNNNDVNNNDENNNNVTLKNKKNDMNQQHYNKNFNHQQHHAHDHYQLTKVNTDNNNSNHIQQQQNNNHLQTNQNNNIIADNSNNLPSNNNIKNSHQQQFNIFNHHNNNYQIKNKNHIQNQQNFQNLQHIQIQQKNNLNNLNNIQQNNLNQFNQLSDDNNHDHYNHQQQHHKTTIIKQNIKISGLKRNREIDEEDNNIVYINNSNFKKRKILKKKNLSSSSNINPSASSLALNSLIKSNKILPISVSSNLTTSPSSKSINGTSKLNIIKEKEILSLSNNIPTSISLDSVNILQPSLPPKLTESLPLKTNNNTSASNPIDAFTVIPLSTLQSTNNEDSGEDSDIVNIPNINTNELKQSHHTIINKKTSKLNNKLSYNSCIISNCIKIIDDKYIHCNNCNKKYIASNIGLNALNISFYKKWYCVNCWDNCKKLKFFEFSCNISDCKYFVNNGNKLLFKGFDELYNHQFQSKDDSNHNYGNFLDAFPHLKDHQKNKQLNTKNKLIIPIKSKTLSINQLKSNNNNKKQLHTNNHPNHQCNKHAQIMNNNNQPQTHNLDHSPPSLHIHDNNISHKPPQIISDNINHIQISSVPIQNNLSYDGLFDTNEQIKCDTCNISYNTNFDIHQQKYIRYKCSNCNKNKDQHLFICDRKNCCNKKKEWKTLRGFIKHFKTLENQQCGLHLINDDIYNTFNIQPCTNYIDCGRYIKLVKYIKFKYNDLDISNDGMCA